MLNAILRLNELTDKGNESSRYRFQGVYVEPWDGGVRVLVTDGKMAAIETIESMRLHGLIDGKTIFFDRDKIKAFKAVFTSGAEVSLIDWSVKVMRLSNEMVVKFEIMESMPPIDNIYPKRDGKYSLALDAERLHKIAKAITSKGLYKNKVKISFDLDSKGHASMALRVTDITGSKDAVLMPVRHWSETP